MKEIFNNLIKAIIIMIYFIILNFAYTKMELQRLVEDIKVFAGAYLVLGILFIERAYKEDSGKRAITGIELLFLSLHSLSIMHVITKFQYDFRLYLLTSSYIIAIYYVLKAIIVYTQDKKQYLKELSDISEIIKEEPIKKEAKKRKSKENNKQKQRSNKKNSEDNKNNVKNDINEKIVVNKKVSNKKATVNKTKSNTKANVNKIASGKKTTVNKEKATSNKKTKVNKNQIASSEKATVSEEKATSNKKTKVNKDKIPSSKKVTVSNKKKTSKNNNRNKMAQNEKGKTNKKEVKEND